MNAEQTKLVKQLETSAYYILEQLRQLSKEIATKPYETDETEELSETIANAYELCDGLQYMREEFGNINVLEDYEKVSKEK